MEVGHGLGQRVKTVDLRAELGLAAVAIEHRDGSYAGPGGLPCCMNDAVDAAELVGNRGEYRPQAWRVGDVGGVQLHFGAGRLHLLQRQNLF